MKRITLLLLLLTLFCGVGLAQQWFIPGPINSNGRLEDICFINPDTGWAVSSYSQIFRTNDGAVSWELQYSGDYYLRSVGFADSLLGFAGSLHASTFLKTTDGGANWRNVAQQLPITATGICGMQWLNRQTFFAVGAWFEPAFLLRSDDRGDSWSALGLSNYAEALVDVHFVSADTGWVCGRGSTGGVILYTTDAGAQWKEVFNTGTPGDYVWKLQMVDEQHLVASVQTFAATGWVLMSADRGRSWSAKPVPDGNIQGIGFLTPKRGWVGGYAPWLYATEDGGDSWVQLPFGGDYNRFQFLGDTLAYASGYQVYKYRDTTVMTGAAPAVGRQFDPQLAVSPNPAKEQATISLQLPRANNVDINLYDSRGALIQRIFNGRLQAGRHTFPLRLGQTAGYYLVGLQVNEGLYSVPLIIR